ncbi:type II secretion system protein GspG [uncultured Winogradskyella sp.]|uniref:type II secretion system protein GspG n=1 Tax=uncultured Winogradskyella sp. TaxID=395353 RepID=UPI0030EBEA09|tara:strand:+ start:3573 stop:4022 length:450 start_codon:yes stop_codon:yes gene_type:complete
MLDLITQLLLWCEDYKFSKSKKTRRQFEKENNLPKTIMIHPVWKLVIILVISILLLQPVIGYVFFSDYGLKQTSEKIVEINKILEKERTDIGNYPEELKTIIRNNPLRKNITKDYWGNEFFYQQLENGESYTIISKGKDGVLKTEDDVK